MQQQYETEIQIRTRIIEALKDKRRNSEGEVDGAKVQAELSDPRYTAWIEGHIANAKKAGRLITDQQFRDLQTRREFRENDRARFVGEARLERSPVTQRDVLRPTGQLGRITKTQRTTAAGVVFTFMPDIDRKTLEAADAGLDVEVMEITTNKWFEFERLP